MPRVVPSYTIQNPTVSSVNNLSIRRQSDGQGGFDTVVTAYYDLVDELGNRVASGAVSLALNASQQSQIGTFVTNNVLPLIVTQENL